jgi:hypothetical protein
MTRVLPVLLVFLVSGCIRPARLQYDYGRSFTEAMNSQSDLTRADAKGGGYTLAGHEGVLLRMRVIEESTDVETGTTQALNQ